MNHMTDRLTLRLMTLNDAEAIYSYRSLPEVNTYTYTPVWASLDTAIAHVEKHVPMIANPKSGFSNWMIVRNDTDDVVGDVFLNRDTEMKGATEIGYMFHPDHAGQGFATEAVRAVLRIGFEDWGEHRIYARVDEENVGSVRVCEKLGMRQEARFIENDKRGNVWSNELIFAMLNREWTDLVGDES